MAIDSAAKRFSMLGFGDDAFGYLPTGTVDAEARASLVDLYEGVPPGVVIVGAAVYCVYYTPISDRIIVMNMPLNDAYEVMDTEIIEIVVMSTPINDRAEVLSVPLEDDYEVLNTPITC